MSVSSVWSLDSRVYSSLGPMGHSEAETACRMCSVRHNALFRDREGAPMGYMLTTPTRIMLIAQRLNFSVTPESIVSVCCRVA